MFIVVPLLGLSLLPYFIVILVPIRSTSMFIDVASLSIHNVNSDKCYTIPPGDAGACTGFAKLIVGGVMLGPRSPALVLLCFAVIHSWSQWIVWREGGE